MIDDNKKTRQRAKFSTESDAEKYNIAKRCFNAVLDCNFKGSIIQEKYDFAAKQFIKDKAEYYYSTFATAEEKKIYATKKAEYENLHQSNGTFFKLNAQAQQYIEQIYKITDMEELHNYIKGNNPFNKEIPLHDLKDAIINRTRGLGDKDGIYSAVNAKLAQYEEYKQTKKAQENKEKSLRTLQENIYIAKLDMEDFLNSEFIYKKDYCKSNSLSENIFDKRVATVKENDYEYFLDYERRVQEKKENYYDLLKPVVTDIISNIKSNPDYNIIDYYLTYKDSYTFADLCLSCNKHKLDIRALKTFLSNRNVNVRSTLSHDAFINDKYIAYNHEFNAEEKEQIYQYAKEHHIPFNDTNVSLLVARYYKNKNQNTKAHI